MADRHLDRDILESFSRGALGSARSLQVERHLRSGCGVCQPLVDEIVFAFAPEECASDLTDEVWGRLFANLEQRVARVSLERSVAPRLVAELLTAPELVRDHRRFHTLAVCEVLIERSFDAGFSDPAQAIELAELSIQASDLIGCGQYCRSVVQDVRARAWAHLGNARRLAGDLTGAEGALLRAESLLEDGSADPLEEARVLDFKASVLSDLGRFERAAETLDAVIEIYEDIKISLTAL